MAYAWNKSLKYLAELRGLKRRPALVTIVRVVSATASSLQPQWAVSEVRSPRQLRRPRLLRPNLQVLPKKIQLLTARTKPKSPRNPRKAKRNLMMQRVTKVRTCFRLEIVGRLHLRHFLTQQNCCRVTLCFSYRVFVQTVSSGAIEDAYTLGNEIGRYEHGKHFEAVVDF